jgi:ABC-type sugar transport system substrate-binding protein
MMAKGCYQALKERELDIPIVSTGGSPDDYQMLVDGIESANMTAPVSLQGIQTFKNLYEFVVEGKTPAEKRKALPIIPASADKLDEFVAWDDYAAAYNYVYNN